MPMLPVFLRLWTDPATRARAIACWWGRGEVPAKSERVNQRAALRLSHPWPRF